MPIPFTLSGASGHRSLEMSSLTWAGDILLLMPQYPNLENPVWYGIEKTTLFHRIKTPHIPIEPIEFEFRLKDLPDRIPGFQGFEAVCYVNGKLFFLIEAEEDDLMSGYLVGGEICIPEKIIDVNIEHIVKINPPANIHNMSFESILYTRNSLWTLFEANGINANQNPNTSVFSLGLNLKKQLSFPHVEYRITDFTSVDNHGKFWAINYFWPGYRKHVSPETDYYVNTFGAGETHQKYDHVERLLEFQITPKGIFPTETQPVEIVLEENNPRNWEGLVKLDELGFLIISDEHPETIFAFIPYSLK
jgi:hypothetical protein